jgi:hypothetical protein
MTCAGSTKRCTRCGWELRLSMFAKDASKKSGYKSWCRACDNERCRRYYEANREKKLAYMRARNERPREERGWRGRSERWRSA